MKKRITILILTISLLSLLGTGVAHAAPGTKYIRDDATGGDCTTIGYWDLATKTCTLRMNLTDSIVIASAGITLDGRGYSITGAGTGTGIEATPLSLPSTIENVQVSNFGVGIMDMHSAVRIIHTTLLNNGWGIGLMHPHGSSIINNAISNNDIGIECALGGLAEVTNNTISGNDIAFTDIFCGGTWTYNTFRDNKTLFNGEMDLGPLVYRNNFIGNGPSMLSHCQGVSLFRPAPIGGNYWSDYHTPAQGCQDLNRDGFCDAPYNLFNKFGGFCASDNLPWTRQNGWLVLDVDQVIQGTQRACANEWINKKGICGSLEAKLQAAKAAVGREQFGVAENMLNAFLQELDAQKGKAVNQQAYDLLKAEVRNLIDKLPR